MLVRVLNFASNWTGRRATSNPVPEGVSGGPRPMTGILPSLTPEQRERVLTSGSSAETFGDPAKLLQPSTHKP